MCIYIYIYIYIYLTSLSIHLLMDTWVAFLFLKTKEAEKSWGAGWEYTSPVINGLLFFNVPARKGGTIFHTGFSTSCLLFLTALI